MSGLRTAHFFAIKNGFPERNPPYLNYLSSSLKLLSDFFCNFFKFVSGELHFRIG